MAKVGLIVPFFGKPEKTQIRFFEWLDKPETVDKFNALGINKNDIYPTLGRPDEVLNDQGIKFMECVPKGLFIQRAVSNQKSTLDPDYYVCIDGEGIPFNNIFEILNQLVTQPFLGVLACRKNNLGLGDSGREIVERFELFILSKIFGTELIDGQCGCWGFRRDFLNAKKLDAEGFEIELDFLIKLLMVGREICYIPVDIISDPEDKTTFRLSNHKEKIEFICRMLNRGKEEIGGFINAFEEDHDILPDEYKKAINDISYKPLGIKIRCVGVCNSCLYKTT